MNHDFDTDEPRPGRFHEEHYDPYGKSSPAMAAAARLLGILSLFFFWMIYLALPLAATSVVLALLSRGSGSVKRRVRGIVITGIVSMVLTTGVTAYSVYKVFTTPSLKAQMDVMVRYYLGYGLDEVFGTGGESDEGTFSNGDAIPGVSGETDQSEGNETDEAAADNSAVPSQDDTAPVPYPGSYGQEGGYL